MKLSDHIKKMSAASPLRKVEDQAGHEHDQTGRFTGPGGSNPAQVQPSVDTQAEAKTQPQEQPETREQQMERYRTGKGHDVDGLISERLHTGEYSQPGRMGGSHVVFTVGYPGAGKNGVIEKFYKGNLDKKPNPQNPKAPRIGPHPWFKDARVIDSDDIKKTIPIYGDRPDANGLHSSQGPESLEELAKYPKDEVENLNRWIKDNTGFNGPIEFAQKSGIKHFDPNDPTKWPGGLTHALSSYLADHQMRDITSSKPGPDEPNAIFAGLGSEKYLKWIDDAISNGRRVIIHQARVPRSVSMHRRTELADRTMRPDITSAMQQKVDSFIPILARHYNEIRKKNPTAINWEVTNPWNDRDLEDAWKAGWGGYDRLESGHKPKRPPLPVDRDVPQIVHGKPVHTERDWYDPKGWTEERYTPVKAAARGTNPDDVAVLRKMGNDSEGGEQASMGDAPHEIAAATDDVYHEALEQAKRETDALERHRKEHPEFDPWRLNKAGKIEHTVEKFEHDIADKLEKGEY